MNIRMTMTIAICNQKGGCGKTSVLMMLAYSLASVNKKVGIVDCDFKQGSASRWLEQAPADGVSLIPAVRNGDDCDIILIDTPGSLHELQLPNVAREMRSAEHIVVVSSVSPLDIWATSPCIEYVQKAFDGAVHFLFNRFQPRLHLSQAADEVTTQLGVEAFKTRIPERASFARAQVEGFRVVKAPERRVVAELLVEMLVGGEAS